MRKLPPPMHATSNLQEMEQHPTIKTRQILPIVTGDDQYGYKEGLSTIDAIVGIENYARTSNEIRQIILLDIKKAFGAVSRTALWTSP